MDKSGPPPEVYHPPHAGYQPHGGYPQYPHGYGHQPPHGGVHNTFAPVTNQASNQSTNVVVNMPGKSDDKGKYYKRDWSTQICGCMEDCGGCLCVCFFMPIMMAMTASRMGECFCLPWLVPQALLAMRVKIREANRIQGSICWDCICTSCCPQLSLCQIKREWDNIESGKAPGAEL